MNVRKTVTTTALAVGVVAGSAGIANAVGGGSAPSPTDPAPAEQDNTQDPMLNGSIQAPEAEGQSEADEATALADLATITSDDAAAAALGANPGATVQGVELDNENGSVVYEVTLDDGSAATIEVKVDAGNAAVLHQEADDDEADGIEDQSEADEADEADEAEGLEDEADGIDHENEGEEIGNNGDGVPDADDATETPDGTAAANAG